MTWFLFFFKIPALGHWDCSCWAPHGHPAVQSRAVVLAHSWAAVWWWLCSHSHEPVSVAFLQMSQIRLSPALLIAASTTTLSLICRSFQEFILSSYPLEMSLCPVNPIVRYSNNSRSSSTSFEHSVSLLCPRKVQHVNPYTLDTQEMPRRASKQAMTAPLGHRGPSFAAGFSQKTSSSGYVTTWQSR